MAKKGRKKVKKAQKKAPEEEKAEIIQILKAKCKKEEEELLLAWDEFHTTYPGGLISKEEYLAQCGDKVDSF